MREIIPDRLWVGATGDVGALREFVNAGGRAIVQLSHEVIAEWLPRDLMVGRFPLNDDTGNDPKTVRMAIRFLAELLKSQVPTLVTCGAGMSRSPSIAAAAMAITDSRPVEDCLIEITRTGSADVSPAFWSDVVAAARAMNHG